MKKWIYLIGAGFFMLTGTGSVAQAATKAVKFVLAGGETKICEVSSVTAITLNSTLDSLVIARNGRLHTIAVADIKELKYGDYTSTVDVVYDGATATVENPYAFDGVSVAINGAHVWVTDDYGSEIEYQLSGNSDNGCFKIYSSVKYQITLLGLRLTNPTGPAINSQSKKKGTIKSQKGYENELTDGVSYAEAYNNEDQKGTIFSEGQLIFKGAGKTTVNGWNKYGICSDDYISIENSTLVVNHTMDDGIRAKDSLLISGGNVSVNTAGKCGANSIKSKNLLRIIEGELTLINEAVGGVVSAVGDTTLIYPSDIESSGGSSSGSGSGSTGPGGNRPGGPGSSGSGTVSTTNYTGINFNGNALSADGDIFISGGKLTIEHTGAMSKGIKSDGNLSISGGTVSINGTGTAVLVNNDVTYCTSIKTDGNLDITGGVLTFTQSGRGGRGISVDGAARFGESGNDEALSLDVRTSGSFLYSTSGGWESNIEGSAKAIKVDGDITIDGGYIYAQTATDGGEGMESKASIVINGGYIECNTYDDGINAATKITVNDGFVYSHASGNDGIDCNGSQGFEFNGGVIMAAGINAPEEGFDCDNSSFKINGGILIGTGGNTSNPTSAIQPFATVSNVSLTKDRYLSVKKSDGTVLFSFKCPNTVSSGTVLLSSPDFVAGTSYSLVYGATAVSDTETSCFEGVYTTGGTLTGGSVKSFTPNKK
ncbi:MAG: carbohydrate-binding domain-containing protein [Coprobacter sp.]|nr:carbohydrate-binding domain-containing protein [Coprobacter sp.]